MKKIKKLAIYSAIGTMSLTSLMACGEKEIDDNTESYVEVPESKEVAFSDKTALEQILVDVNENETKIFQPYQHLFFVRVDSFQRDASYCSAEFDGGSINVADGYKVLDIENFTEYKGETRGFDVWFVNEVPVEVTPVYNEMLERYDYGHFGVPVEEKEETVQKVK